MRFPHNRIIKYTINHCTLHSITMPNHEAMRIKNQFSAKANTSIVIKFNNVFQITIFLLQSTSFLFLIFILICAATLVKTF